MEQMDATALAAWFTDTLKLPQYATAITEDEVDGDALLDLEKRDNLADLGIESNVHQSKVRGALAKLGRKRAAESLPSGTDVARAKHARLAGAEAEVTPGPAAAPSATAVEACLEQAGFQLSSRRPLNWNWPHAPRRRPRPRPRRRRFSWHSRRHTAQTGIFT